MTKRRWIALSSSGLFAAISGVFLLTVSPSAPAQTTSTPVNLPVVSTISATGQQLVSEKRITRTVTEFTYRLTVRNSGSALIAVSGRSISSSPLVTFTDNTVSIGDVAASSSANSTDTYTIRVDRTQPFNPNSITWQFMGAPGDGVPPDPGPANDLTVAGIDSDSDGVRDDVERWIAVTYPQSARARASLFELANTAGAEIAAGTNSSMATAAAARSESAVDCLSYLFGDNASTILAKFEEVFINNDPRTIAELQFQSVSDDASSRVLPRSQRGTRCAFDPESLPN